MKGFNVLHPMGWDAFGLPAEQHAIKTGEHPRENTAKNVANFKRQLNSIGFNYDWDREVNTTDPGYFKWTQWIFRLLYESWFDPKQGKARPITAFREEIKLWKSYSTYPDESIRRIVDSRRLAYVSETLVNWCPTLGTVLANEEVVDGKSEVGGYPIERRLMHQWKLRITAYAERLIDELDGLDWPAAIKTLQRNWIGRSEGARIVFNANANESRGSLMNCEIPVFTTRPDTLFGVTYMVLSPEHPLVDLLTTRKQEDVVAEYRASISSKSDLERTDLADTKTGAFTGLAYAKNPVNDESIPIWIADYVLMSYGTGAIMAVPAHDQRDWDFAVPRDLEIRPVVAAEKRRYCNRKPIRLTNEDSNFVYSNPIDVEFRDSDDYEGQYVMFGNLAAAKNFFGSRFYDYGEIIPVCTTADGVAVQSGFLDGLTTPQAKLKMIDWLEANHAGKQWVNYKLRDWLFSRQRYWGEPFPIVWQDGKHSSLPVSELPLIPPDLDDFKPTGTVEPPLTKATEWVRYSEVATRETHTMPQWAGSCWYYLRFCDPRNGESFVGGEAERYWMSGHHDPIQEQALPNDLQEARNIRAVTQHLLSKPVNKGGVDLYVGGTEHAVLHLLYARFWHKVLYDYGCVSTPEPFQRLVNQGLILGEDGQKMSKSRGNVVNPDEVIGEFGADALRLYEMFMGPLEQVKPWSMAGVQGVARFLARVWRLVMEEDQEGRWILSDAVQDVEPTRAQQRAVHAAIKKVTADIESLSFNTAISAMMVCTNELTAATVKPVSALRTLVQILNPFAPHLTEELNERLEGKFATGGGLLAGRVWPEYDESLLVQDEIEIPVQINGKLRERLTIKKEALTTEVEAAALASPKVQEHLGGKTPRKVIVVPGKLVNIVV